MSDSVRPHRWQPTRLLPPWDSPGKNTGVGCQFLLQCMKVKRDSDVAQSCPTLFDPIDCRLLGSSVHGIFQARVLEWGAIAFSEEYWSGLLFPSPGAWDRACYFCLKNPSDREAWWAAVYGVAQSRTQLKRLSSSSSSRYILAQIT